MPGSNGFSTMEQAGGGVQNNLSSPSSQSGSGSGSGSGFQWESLLPAGVSSALNFISMFTQDMLNRRASDRQHAQNIADWKMQNEYNSPAAQMARLRQAGLNPNLIYSQLSNGQSVMNATSSHPASAAGAGDMSSVNNALMARLQERMVEAQIENIQADTEYTKEQKSSLSERRPLELDKLTYDSFFSQQRAASEYQRGLSLALDNYIHGYRPHSDDSGDIRYRNELLHLDEADSIIKDIADERELRQFDLRYVRELFSDMVLHDKEQFDFDLRQWKKDSAVLSYLSENEWAQFVDYIVSRLASTAVQTSVAYRQFRGFRGR